MIKSNIRRSAKMVFLAGVGIFALLQPAYGDTMKEAIKAAYKTNPQILAARAAIRVAGEGIAQAKSGFRPNISGTISLGIEQSNRSTSSEQNLEPFSQTIQATQSLYAGNQTVNGIKQAEVTVALRRDELRNTEQIVLLNAITAYMDVVQNQARVDLTKNNVNVLKRQLEATKDRFGVGEVTRTDVAQSEARLSGAVADQITAKGDLSQSIATYRRITGLNPGKLKKAPTLPSLPKSPDDAVAIGLHHNPNLAQANKAERIADLAAKIAYGRLLPSVDLIAQGSRTDDSGFENLDTSSYSLTARLTIPFYQTGVVHSQVREAKKLRLQRRIERENARRAVVEEIYLSFEALVARDGEIKSRKEQVRATKIALEGVTQEAAVGSRTTLDVLDAEQEVLDASVALVIAERNAYIAGARLLAAIGKLDVKTLKIDVPTYDPEPHLQEVRDKYWGTKIAGEK